MKNHDFDYVVIGAGSAGCIVAARLAEKKMGSIGLIEAGGRIRNPLNRIPAFVRYAMHQKKIIWPFFTQQDESLHREIFWPRGKGVGGCSLINAMCAVPPTQADINAWIPFGGNTWSAENLLSFHHQLQMPISSPAQIHKISDAFLRATQQLGLSLMPGPNAEQECAGALRVYQKNAKRVTVADAYLYHTTWPKNLTLFKYTLAQKISDNAVLCQRGTETFSISARKKLILCLGALQSPELLLRSHIPLPGIGKNLQDHLCVRIPLKTHHKKTYDLSWWQQGLSGVQFFIAKKGPAASIGAEVCAFIKSSPHLEEPDLQIYLVPAYLDSDARQGQHHGLTFIVSLLKPESRGTLSLGKQDHIGDIRIDPHYLEAASDKARLLAGIRIVQRLALESSLSEHLAAAQKTEVENWSPETMTQFLLENTQSNYHPIGTCRLGNDENGVVNAQLQLHGQENICVVDASIMPIIPAANTQHTVMLIAEKFCSELFCRMG